jgi:hypothetical protein
MRIKTLVTRSSAPRNYSIPMHAPRLLIRSPSFFYSPVPCLAFLVSPHLTIDS